MVIRINISQVYNDKFLELIIYDSMGKQVKRLPFNTFSNSSTCVNELKSGLYIIKVISNNNLISTKKIFVD